MGQRTAPPADRTAGRIGWSCALMLAWAVTADAEVWEARGVGEWPVTIAETRDRAERLATVDAQVVLWRAVVTRVEEAVSVKALGLTREQLSAYIAGLLALPTSRALAVWYSFPLRVFVPGFSCAC